MLIWGLRVRLKILEQGEFFCPTCGGDRHYARKQMRRWFTLFFIPLIPLKVLGEVIECETCHGRFDEQVLHLPTSASLGAMTANAFRVLAAVLVRSGDRSDPALRREAVRCVVAAGSAYDEATLDSDMNVVDPAQVPAYLSPLAPGLAMPGRERLVADATRIARAGGSINDAQRAVLNEVGRALELSPAHVAGVVAQVEQETRTPPI